MLSPRTAKRRRNGSNDRPDDDDDDDDGHVGNDEGNDQLIRTVDLWTGTVAADATDAGALDEKAVGDKDEGMDDDRGAVYHVNLGPFDMTVTFLPSVMVPRLSPGRPRGRRGRWQVAAAPRRRHKLTATEWHLLDAYRRSFPGFAIGLTLTFEDEDETVLERGTVRWSRFEGAATFRLYEGGEGNEGRDNDVPDKEELASATLDAFMDPDDKVASLRTFRRLFAGKGAKGRRRPRLPRRTTTCS
ncbi:hypothetical protein ACHAWF_006227 [Thalassiosira exigua]